MSNNLYEILGVAETASQEEIKTAYRNLTKKWHPDRNNNSPESSAKFSEIAKAYETLGDPAKRQNYDQMKSGAFDPFGSMFSNFFRTQTYQQQWNLDVNSVVEISFVESVTGCTKETTVSSSKVCTKCNGVGATEFTKCLACDGRGGQFTRQGPFQIQHPCNNCRGTGKIQTSNCNECSGSKFILMPEVKLNVTIPPGIDDENNIRISGYGNLGPNGQKGDLYVKVNVSKHEYYRRDAMDIVCLIPVSYSQLIFGDKVKVPVIDGVDEIEIPPYTPSGTKFKIWGKGIPNIHDKTRKGDFVAFVTLDIPDHLTLEQKTLLESLKVLEQSNPTTAKKNFEEFILQSK